MFNIDVFKKSFDFLPLGLRINNLGCVRYLVANNWNGQIGSYRGFAKFETFDFGVRCLTMLLMRYLYKYRLFDVEHLLERYAPYQDSNFPSLYAYKVTLMTGIKKISNDIRLIKIELPLIVFSIAVVENGSEFYNRANNDKEFINYLTELVVKYIDEYLNQVIYPVYGKINEL